MLTIALEAKLKNPRSLHETKLKPKLEIIFQKSDHLRYLCEAVQIPRKIVFVSNSLLLASETERTTCTGAKQREGGGMFIYSCSARQFVFKISCF